MEKEIELLPCPFCGSDKVLLCQWRDTENPNATWIGCENCGISQDSFHHEDADHVKGIATMMWNTRMPNPTQLTAREARLVEALEYYANPENWDQQQFEAYDGDGIERVGFRYTFNDGDVDSDPITIATTVLAGINPNGDAK